MTSTDWNAAIDAAAKVARELQLPWQTIRGGIEDDGFKNPDTIFRTHASAKHAATAIEALRKPDASTASVRERMLSDEVIDEVTRKMFGNCLPVNRLVAHAAITAALDAAGVA